MAFTKDMPFLGYTISDNLSKTPEGFLICHAVPIARTGVQKYLGQEIGVNDLWDQEVNVYRLAEDVFHKDTLASFEGKSVTDDHPSQAVTPDNFSAYHKGHAQNLRNDGDHIIADLLIKDTNLISKVENGVKRQVSAGYNCEYIPYKDGYKQTNIRANHIAVVDKGRAGPKVSIKDDTKLLDEKRRKTPMDRKKAISMLLHSFAKDATAEEFQRILAVVDAEPEGEKESEKEKEDKEKNVVDKMLDALRGKDKKAKDEAEVDPMEARMAALEDSMKKIADGMKANDKAKDEKEDGDIVEKILKSDDAEGETEEEKEEKKAEDEDAEEKEEKKEDKKEANDAAFVNVVKNLKPVIAKLSAKDQQMVKDALRKSIHTSDSSNSYAKIKEAASSHAKTTTDSTQDVSEIGKNWAKQHNPHYKNAQ